MSLGSLIRLFLVDGKPNGLRTLEISNMTIYTTIFPRTRLKEFLNREESNKPGCYILLGNKLDDPDQTLVYVGEGETVKDRLRSHAQGENQKDFWDQAIVFTSKDDYLTKTQIQYLESKIYILIKNAEKAQLKNDQTPSLPNLSEVDTAEMTQFLEAIQLIMSSVGIDILEPKRFGPIVKQEKKEIIYEFKIHNAHGRMKIDEEKYIVLEGSTAVMKERPSVTKGISNMRKMLVDTGVLKKKFNEDLYVFTSNYVFNSPSYAAAAICGGNENGRRQWKYQGKSLNELEEQDLNK